eukprot:TRINITY_DN26961_c0_g1_i1.p1 TRINITY_DN26961_c0_g1~~TRINITY_DN26961_c0_g1_i1.p1  ORF type:complete len:239 (+),score=5.04 TRINITY_DN26961_c0_g1_i1:125-841(+)
MSHSRVSPVLGCPGKGNLFTIMYKSNVFARKNDQSKQRPPLASPLQPECLTVAYPPYWDAQGEDFALFQVHPESGEWRTVKDKFSESMPSQVVQIYRVQNKALWKKYSLCKQEIQANTTGNVEELLFHGTPAHNVETVVRNGLDFRLASQSGVLGSGIYFAQSSCTSSGYLQGSQKMFLCRVAVGTSTQGESRLRRPPERTKNRLYDSVHGRLGTDRTFCIFDNNQCYLEWVIEFLTH